jgi:nicotinic acid phosphoribosyltransferase
MKKSDKKEILQTVHKELNYKKLYKRLRKDIVKLRYHTFVDQSPFDSDYMNGTWNTIEILEALAEDREPELIFRFDVSAQNAFTTPVLQ